MDASMKASSFTIVGNVVDILGRRTYAAEVAIKDGRVVAIDESAERPTTFLLPGFVDAHVHVESSMLVPTEFARAAVVHGTVATVSDPHEIGNVLAVAGVEALLDDPRIRYLSEMMNYPGVLGGDPDCLAKITAAQRRHKRVDGH